MADDQIFSKLILLKGFAILTSSQGTRLCANLDISRHGRTALYPPPWKFLLRGGSHRYKDTASLPRISRL